MACSSCTGSAQRGWRIADEHLDAPVLLSAGRRIVVGNRVAAPLAGCNQGRTGAQKESVRPRRVSVGARAYTDRVHRFIPSEASNAPHEVDEHQEHDRSQTCEDQTRKTEVVWIDG